jgi:hypothetical protein
MGGFIEQNLATIVIVIIGGLLTYIFKRAEWSTNKRIDMVEQTTEKRVEKVDKRSEEIEYNYTAKFNEVNKKIDNQTAIMQEGFNDINKNYMPRTEITELIYHIGNHFDKATNTIVAQIEGTEERLTRRIVETEKDVKQILKGQKDE